MDRATAERITTNALHTITAAKRPTFKKARLDLHRGLGEKGWRLSSPTLKVPHATSPDGKIRYWFKAQAVYWTYGPPHSLRGGALSTHDDIRKPDALETLLRDKDHYVKTAEEWASKGIR